MAAKYDTVVIGTGFGGSVAACRLSQAGLQVAVFERGRRYGENKFPRDWNDPLNGWLWSHEQGLFDVKSLSEMFVVQSAGYGGGSLIYANVHMRVPADGFARGWPAPYSRAMLDPYYDLVGHMLDITAIKETPYNKLPPKTELMRNAAAKLGRSDQFFYPNLAVNFGNPDQPKANKFGAIQRGCNHCGDCDIGCNTQAKNTLDVNYLKVAEDTGRITLHLRTSVYKLEPCDGGYRVHYKDHESGQDGAVEARAVFVCAGAVNTTELLLRCREQFQTLPRISPALGQRYSGNGDYLAWAFDTAQQYAPWVGPTITTAIVYDRGTDDDRTWFVFEEGGYPRQISALVELLARSGSLSGIDVLARRDLERFVHAHAARHVGQNREGTAHGGAFLAMGRDRANGRIELTPFTNLLHIVWDTPSNMPLYSAAQRFSADVAGALGGKLGDNPLWKYLRQPVSVHNLGGCVMAEHPAHGVTDPGGEVFGYPNLFVLDGAALPEATGSNPSHTIAAVAERNIERFIRRYKNDPAWRCPEAALARPIDDPIDHVKIPKGGTARPETLALGITFTETMTGFLLRTSRLPGSQPEYEDLAAKAKAEGSIGQFTLTITMPDIDAFITDRNHAGVAVGDVIVTGLTDSGGGRVTAGVFHLFEPTEDFYARKMLYTLPFYGLRGQPYLLMGYKDVRDHGSLDVWAATSTLYTVIRDGHDTQGPVVAAGVLHILPKDFAHQLTTFHVTGGGSPLARTETMARFGRVFMGTLFDVFVRPHLDV